MLFFGRDPCKGYGKAKAQATPGYYAMMSAPFMLGRGFLPEEGAVRKGSVVALTYRL
jgi:hypothetical protein